MEKKYSTEAEVAVSWNSLPPVANTDFSQCVHLAVHLLSSVFELVKKALKAVLVGKVTGCAGTATWFSYTTTGLQSHNSCLYSHSALLALFMPHSVASITLKSENHTMVHMRVPKLTPRHTHTAGGAMVLECLLQIVKMEKRVKHEEDCVRRVPSTPEADSCPSESGKSSGEEEEQQQCCPRRTSSSN